MPRKSTQIMTTTLTSDQHSPMPNSPKYMRLGASISPEIVNVFQQAVSPGAAPGLHLAPLAGQAGGEAIAVSVQAWVKNLAYTKDVFLDVYLLGEDAAVVHHELLPLLYQEPAGGGGDFFAAGAAVPAPGAPGGAQALQFRLYGHMDGQVYTDGVLHSHALVSAPAARAKAEVPAKSPGTAKATPTAKAPKASAKGGTPALPPPAVARAATKAPLPAAPQGPVTTTSVEAAKTTKPRAARKS